MKRYLVVNAMMVFMLSQGCTVRHTHAVTSKDAGKFKSKPVTKTWKPTPRCNVLGKAKTTHVYVVVTKDCMVKGQTTVSMVVLNKERKGRVAGEHAMQAATSILGYRPTLGILTYGMVKGRYLVLAAVVDPALARK